MKSRRGWTRREWLWTAAAGLSLPHLALAAEVSTKPAKSKLGMPGLHPGRVVAVSHPTCILDGKFQADPIRRMMDEGMMELTDAEDPTGAWKVFFERGDVVGIKVSPVGGPTLSSDPLVLHQVVDGLIQAGVRARDIIVFNRYRQEMFAAGIHQWLPPDRSEEHTSELQSR